MNTTRIRRLPVGDNGTRYFHPNGYVIERQRRNWSNRGSQGNSSEKVPLYWWDIYKHWAKREADLERYRLQAAFSRPVETTDSLTEARAWCDKNPRVGWTDNP